MLEKQKNNLNKKRELMKVKKIQNELNKNDEMWFIVQAFFKGMQKENYDLSLYLEACQVEISKNGLNNYLVKLFIEYLVEEKDEEGEIEEIDKVKKIQVVESYSDDFKESILVEIIDEIEKTTKW